jgi:single-strand DNA-binding protein
MSVNRAIIVGNLGKTPDLRRTPGGQTVCQLSVATNESYTDKQGTRNQRTEWHRVVVWGRSAESCAAYLSKGRPVCVEGRLQTRSWDDRDGKKRWMTEIVANRVHFLGSGAGRAGAAEPTAMAAREDDGEPEHGAEEAPLSEPPLELEETGPVAAREPSLPGLGPAVEPPPRAGRTRCAR